VKKQANGWKKNELQIRLEPRARNLSVSSHAGVRFRGSLLEHRTYVQNWHSNLSVQHNHPDKRG
jgi:hypothetical protein